MEERLTAARFHRAVLEVPQVGGGAPRPARLAEVREAADPAAEDAEELKEEHVDYPCHVPLLYKTHTSNPGFSTPQATDYGDVGELAEPGSRNRYPGVSEGVAGFHLGGEDGGMPTGAPKVGRLLARLLV